MVGPAERSTQPTPVPWGWVGAVCAGRLGLYGVSAGAMAWGYMSDELYYLACAERLAWGFVDHPPLSLAVLAVQRALLGDSLLALRLAPALMACGTSVLCALLAREMGGGRVAQALAALAAAVFPVYLGVSGFYSMNALDPVVWTGAALLFARIANGGDPRWWLALGVVLGLGLLNKLSVLGLGFGLGVGLLATSDRRWIATPWPWAAAAVAALLFLPHVVWQLQNDWPTLEFMRRATGEKLVRKSPLEFLVEQVLVTSPLMIPLWVSGLVFFFGLDSGRRYRTLGWIWGAVFAFLLARGSSRANYIGPAYAVLLAGGAIVFEDLARRPALRWLPASAAALFVLASAVLAPLGFELMPPDRLAAYQRTLGIEAPSGERDAASEVPYHLALRLGWRELARAVASAEAQLPAEERAEAVVWSGAFGPAGAIDFFGPEYGLPPSIAPHNSFWLWGPGDASGAVVIAVHDSGEELRRWFEEVRPAGDFPCPYCAGWVQELSIWICRGARRPLSELWQEWKRFI